MEDNKDYTRGVLKVYESFTDEEYNVSRCLGYSKLKDIYDNPEILIEEDRVKKAEWLDFGTLVDLILTDPTSLDDKVYINDTLPTEQFKNIAEYMVENDLWLDPMLLTDEQIEEAYSQSGSNVKWLIDTKRKKLVEECSDYIQLLTTHRDKLIVTSDLFNEATKVAEVFCTHRWTRDLFLDEETQKKHGIEILYQFKIKYVYNNLVCKSKIDVLVVDHANKLIIPWDIKTGSDYPRTFIRSGIYKYRYCYQGVLYREGLKAFIKKIDALKDYKIGLFGFVYMSRVKPVYPVKVRISEYLHEQIRDSGVDNGAYELLSLNEIVEATNFYIAKVDEGTPMVEPLDLYNSSGEIILGPVSKGYPF